MARHKKPTREPALDAAADELRRELGFDELTYEACVRELFADVLAPASRPATDPARVTQMGPGRRSGTKPNNPNPKEK